MISINNGEKNKKYRVKHIGITNKNMLYRLGAFGLNIGSEISIKQKCLLNGPSVVEVNGQYLSLRQSDARLIALEE
ncbi:FeoA family protein [Staphylococcus saccharolyticus]|uniref:FeoA family protein n=1 Tax=Staphylococcus saccharolyticus TaxID=33028 RepID=UPI000E1BB279|nr:FeoA domain-containing protein [Staphylococcus saccharolyticus]MBL7564690.1 FeoA domain-containing protein [Staphylococcus saccharolyticus]MBL7571046.1 FeoA domain-containing protein [Staphylococcus saccharolyticus]MBL7573764.1 FeoA domain-containing protein [Staphylococcus saccharolyticus]MBL7584448.1 FeoA domain-containing protein [Staphylococcus saccharolyticus]MBL7639310.1 FeoA domain-containing protein [Staphylococcus saccharolyticus]